MSAIEATTPGWVLRLYIAGKTPLAERTLDNLRAICEDYLSGDYSLSIVDILESPQAVEDTGIIAIPTVVREAPPPSRRIIGDLSNTRRVLEGLGIAARTDSGLAR